MTLAATLDRAGARAGFGARLARASWTALAAVVAVELGQIAERGVPHAAIAGFVLGGALAVAALVLLVAGRRPGRVEAARRLDAALAKGSLVETAAETLDGRHAPFGALLVKDAETALASADVKKLVPIEPPRALGAGAGAALLLLALALGPAAERPPEDATPRRWEVDLDETARGGAPARRKDPRSVKVGRATDGAKGPKLDDATAKALLRELKDLEKLLAARSGTPPSPAEEQQARDLDAAIKRGDENAVRAAMKALATSGTASSAKAVAKAADTLSGRRTGEDGSSGGAGSGTGNTVANGTGTAHGGEVGADRGKGAREEDSWRVVEAIDRYRASIE